MTTNMWKSIILVPRRMEIELGLVGMEQLGEREVVRQAQEGSRSAFDELFHRHKTFIYNICYRMLGSAEDATDATQNAFIEAYRSLKGFRGEASFRSWLCRIAMNVCAAMVRQEQRRRSLAQKFEPTKRARSDDRVWEAVLELSPDLRSVLVLFYFQDMSCGEAAQALRCSSGAVRVRLHRARAAFKKKYEGLQK